jgi:GAF domain-containing protein
LAHAEHSYIILFDAELNSGEVCVEFPREVGMFGKVIPVNEGFIERNLLKVINPIVIDDVEHDPTPAAANVRTVNDSIKSTVIVPIIVDEDVKGSFAFNFLSSKQEFTPEEIEHFNSLGEVAALIFTNAYLLKETRIQTEKLEALRKAMLAITDESRREPLLRTIIEEAIKLLMADGGGIYKYKPRRNLLELVEDYKWPKHIGVLLKPGEGLSGQLFISNKEYLATPDYQNSEYKAEAITEPVGSTLGVPLYWRNRRTGVLYVNGELGRNFKEEEAALLQRFAAMASIALEHSRLRVRDGYMVKRLQSLALATNDIISRIDDPDMDGQLTQIAKYAHEILNA